MKRASRIVGLGLCWLAAALATPITTTLIETAQPFDVNGGGGFVANTGGSNFEMYCIDYRNDIYSETEYAVNITDLGADTLIDTRYGETATATFSYNVSSSPSNVAVGSSTYSVNSAFNRYLLAAYLITQYNQSSVTANDVAIEDTIWNLLDVNDVLHSPTNSSSGPSELSLALAWEAGQSSGQLQTFANTVDIIDTTNLGSRTDTGCASSTSNERYCSGFQEMITFDPPAVPEPSMLTLLGAGMILLGVLRKRRSR